MAKKLNSLTKLIKERGFFSTCDYILHYLFLRKTNGPFTYGTRESYLKDGAEFIDLSSHTVEENRRIWNEYDWSKKGEDFGEWVKEYKGIDPAKWKKNLIDGMMLKYIEKHSNILEIGPGAGRWTEFLIKLAKTIVIADISEKCLDICRKRFRPINNIEYHLIKNNLEFIEDNSIDYIWSYDVFVHINPTDIEKYIEEFARILVGGGKAIIHHSGDYSSFEEMKKGWRTFMNTELFAKVISKYGFEMIEQNDDLVHKPGDIISVFKKPKD